MSNRFKTVFLIILLAFVLVLGIFLCTYFNDIRTDTTSNPHLLSENDAIKIATKELEKLGYNNQVIVTAKLDKTEDQSIWYFWTTNNEFLIEINAVSGKLQAFTNLSFDDTKISSTYDKELAQNIAKQIYSNLGYADGEYEIADLKMNVAGSSLWQVDFCKKYDDVYNPYECIRVIFVPEVNTLKSLVIFDYTTENNPVIVTEQQSIEIAKNFDEQNYHELSIKSSTATLGFTKTNSSIVRKSWIVEIEYNDNSFTNIHTYYIDATTGDILSLNSTL